MTDIVTEIEDFFAPVEKEAVVLWSDFLADLKYMATEGAALAKWAESVDPGIQVQVQALITAGEQAASLLVAKGNPALANLISSGVDAAEQTAANLIQKATGNSATGVAASALATSGLSDLGAIATNLATVGYTKAIAALAAAAAPITIINAPAQSAAAASTLTSPAPSIVITSGTPGAFGSLG